MALSLPPGHQPLCPGEGGRGFSVHTLCMSPIAVEATCLKHVFFFKAYHLSNASFVYLGTGRICGSRPAHF